MSILVSVSELRTRVQTDCNLPAFTSTTAITETAVLDFIRRGAQKLAGLVQSNGAGEQYLTLNTTLTTVPDVPVVSLPTNTLDVVRLALFDNDYETQLEVAPLDGWSPEQIFWGTEDYPRYRVMGNTITLFPTPTRARDLRLYYTVGFTVTDTSDVLALRPNWDEYIVAWACIFVKNRVKEDASEFQQSMLMAQQDIISQLKRDRGGVRQVRDVRLPVFGVSRRRWS